MWTSSEVKKGYERGGVERGTLIDVLGKRKGVRTSSGYDPIVKTEKKERVFVDKTREEENPLVAQREEHMSIWGGGGIFRGGKFTSLLRKGIIALGPCLTERRTEGGGWY